MILLQKKKKERKKAEYQNEQPLLHEPPNSQIEHSLSHISNISKVEK